MEQITSHVLMIRPMAFGFNPETAEDNVFQQKPDENKVSDIASEAVREFDDLVRLLENEGINVLVVEDTAIPETPDALFPNNWISMHEDGTLVTYPMYSLLRRGERREDIIDEVASRFDIDHRIHFEVFEKHNQYLEGTGSMVLDRVNQVAYACISDRTDPHLLNEWCDQMEYTPHTFTAVSHGKPIYHTNVMMAIASNVAVVCLECIPDEIERKALKESLSMNHVIIEISNAQVESFVGNMLALANNFGEELMVMSARALENISPEQKKEIEQFCRIVASPLPTIEEVGGGSARCMIAEIFLNPK